MTGELVSCSLQMGVWRTSTNWNTLYSHISYIIMELKMCCIIFHNNGHRRGGGGAREHGREEEGNDLISPWEHANER